MKTLWVSILAFTSAMSAQDTNFESFCKEHIQDSSNVSKDEFKKIEAFLASAYADSPMVKGNKKLTHYFLKKKLVNDDLESGFISNTVYFNNNPEERNECIVVYVTWNEPYPSYINGMIEALKKVGYKGHLRYQIGGYPFLKQGSLKSIDMPYAFKACALKEAASEGYKKLLWLDSSIVPMKNLDTIFEIMQTHGYFILFSGASCYSQLQYEALRDRVYNAMKQGVKDIKKIKHITAPILGFDLSHPSGESIVNELYEAGISNKDIFSSSWGDEVVISWLLAKHNLKPTAYWFDFLFKESDVGSSSDRHYFMMRCNRPEGRS